MEVINAFALPLALLAVVITGVVVARRRDQARFTGSLQRRSLVAVEDHTAVGAAVGVGGTVWDMTSNVSRLAGLDVAVFRRMSTLEMTPTAAWVREPGSTPGVVAALRVKMNGKTTGFASRHTTTQNGVQVVVARLPHPIEGRLMLEPRHVAFDPDRFAGMEDRLVDAGMIARTLDDDVLGRWFAVMGGNADPSIVRTDRRLRAVLWALRQKVSGANEHLSDAERRELETLVPPTQRTTAIESVIIDGDLLILTGQSFPWQVGVSDTLLDIAQAVTVGH
ncbi:MAG: hypothetical protein AB8G26_08040 [Ilumatobacter sp.]